MPTRTGKKLKAEARLFSVRKTIKSLSRKNFTELEVQLTNLNQQLEHLEQLVRNYTTAVNDEYPKLSEEDIQMLSDAYSQSIAGCESVLSFRNNDQYKDKLSYKSMAKMADRTRKFLTSDLRALTALNAKIGETLPQALENARTAVINVDNMNIEIAKGGCMSSRLPLSITTKDGHKIEGMFTKTTDYNFAERSNAIFQKLIDMSSSDSAKLFWRNQMLSKDDITTNSLALQKKVLFYEALVKKPDDLLEAFSKLGNYAILDGNAFSEQEKKNLQDYFTSIRKDAKKLANDYSMNTDRLKIEGGANIDKRNTAMSIVANMLGRPNLLANSVSMTIEAGGVKQTGTFMEFIKGASDLSHLNPDDPFFNCSITDGIDKRPVLKDMADLQVIDYICGNVDRHSGNMLYIIDTDDKGKTYLKGIKAIDNDGSFAVRNLSNGLGRLSNVKGMQVISESMANIVACISPESLKLSLKGTGLSDKSIDAAVERLNDIKSGIKNKVLRIVKDEQWSEIKLNNLRKPRYEREHYGYGVFTMISIQFDEAMRAEEMKKILNNNPDEDFVLKDAEMNTSKKGFELNEAEQIKAKEGINKVVEELNAVKDVWFGSQKFTNMLNSAKALQNQMAEWSKQSEEQPKAVWDADKLEKMTNDLREKTEAYLERKYAQSASKANRDNSIKRMLAANTAIDFTHKFLDKIELSVWDEYRQNNVDHNMIQFAKQRQEEMKVGDKKPQMQKNM